MAKKSKPSRKSKAWFVPVRGSYLPSRVQGWLCYFVFLGYVAITTILSFDINVTVWYQALATFSMWVTGAVILHFVAEANS